MSETLRGPYCCHSIPCALHAKGGAGAQGFRRFRMRQSVAATCVDLVTEVQVKHAAAAAGAHLSLAQVLDAQLLGLQEVEQVGPLALLDAPE